MTSVKSSLILIAIIAGSVLAAEIVARLALWRPAPEAEVGDIRYGYTPVPLGDYHPHQDGVYITGAIHRFRPFHVQVNGDGFRNRDELRSDRVRVLALGDSQTFGLFVNSQDVWTDWLEHGLNERGLDVQVLNNGLPGATIMEELEYFREKGHLLRPSLVILCVFANDVSDMARPASAREEGMNIERSVRFSGLRWFLGHNSALYVAARSIRDRLTMRETDERNRAVMQAGPPGSAFTPAVLGPTTTVQAAELEQRYAHRFGQFADEVAKAGSGLLVAYLPFPGEVRSDSRAAALIKEQAAARAIPFVDLSEALGQYPLNEVYLMRPGDPSYNSDIHLSRFGHIRVAKAIAEGIRRNDLIAVPAR